MTWRDQIAVHTDLTWRDVLARAPHGVGQNATKRAAIKRMLRAHPEWSNRRIVEAVHILIVTDDDLHSPVVLP